MPHELFLTTRQTTKLRNAFDNYLSTDIKLSKPQISKIIQSGGSFGSWLDNLGKKALTNIAIPLARDNLPGLVSNLIHSSAINKFGRKISGKGAVRAGKGFTLFISNEDMNDIIKDIKPLKDSCVLIDGVTETVKDEIKKQEGRFLGALSAPLTASLIQPVISSVVKGISARGVRRARRGYINKNPLHPLKNIKITNDVFSKNNLPRVKDGVHVINLDDKNSKRTQWVSLFIYKNVAIYFDSFGIEYIPQEVLNKVRDKSITHNIFRMQDNESNMCGFYCIAFIEYMLPGKTLLGYTNLFSPNDYKKNDKIIYKYFKDKYGRRSKS